MLLSNIFINNFMIKLENLLMEQTNLTLFEQALSTFHVNTMILLQDYSNLPQLDNQFRIRLYEKNPYESIIPFFENWLKSNSFIQFTDEFKMIYFFMNIPKEYRTAEQSPYFIVGPFLEVLPAIEEIQEIMSKCKVPVHLLKDLSEFYASTPVVENIAILESLMVNLGSGLFHQEYVVTHLPNSEKFPLKTTPIDSKFQQQPQIAISSIEERYEVEHKMLDAISNGDYKHAYEFHQKLLSYYIEPRTDNLLRNAQNFQIILNTLCRKAVEQSGVHPLYIDELSTKFSILINQTYSERELSHLSTDMLHKYCLLVKNYAMKGYSQSIKDIISYIDFYYAEDLSLSFFADMFNLTKTYLSGLFKKETGVTLTDFIHQVRIRKALTLLNSSSLSVATIATTCGYNDINYFIRVFKRSCGMSPKQYQKSILTPRRK